MFRALFAHRLDALRTQNVSVVVYALPPHDEQIVLDTCREC
jgi:molybdopterin synthase catalytic subunit